MSRAGPYSVRAPDHRESVRYLRGTKSVMRLSMPGRLSAAPLTSMHRGLRKRLLLACNGLRSTGLGSVASFRQMSLHGSSFFREVLRDISFSKKGWERPPLPIERG